MIKIFIYIGILFLIFPKTAHAYIDPGSANYLFQILAAIAIGGIFFFKDIIRKAKKILGFSEKEKKTSKDE